MTARGSLRSFLHQAKSHLITAIEKKDRVALVIGNESADLDSITSSILYAYLQSSQPKAPLHVPLLNIPKADIDLRPELLALLPRANIEREHLITLDDLPAFTTLKENLPPQNTRWILVDHNALQGKLGALYSDRVVGVIDHHADESKVPKDTGSEPRIIETSGSCTSLVVNYFRETWNNLSSNQESSGAAHAQGDSSAEDSAVASSWDAQVAQLALASILIDTHNLQDANKTTDHDIKAVAFLEGKVNLCLSTSVSFDQNTFFEQLSEAKKDTDSIAVDGILKKDYKQWTEQGMNIGISSAVKSLDYLQNKSAKESSQKMTSSSSSSVDSLVQLTKHFATQRSLSVYSIMTAFQAEDGSFSRELLVLGLDKQGSAALKRFSQMFGSKLKLEDVKKDDNSDQILHIWRQREVSASRKQVAPMLRQAMTSAGP